MLNMDVIGPVFKWVFVGYRLKLVVKVRYIIVAAGITYLGYVQILFGQQAAGMAYAYFYQKIEIGFLGF